MANYTFEKLKDEYHNKWMDMVISPSKVEQIAEEAKKINNGKKVYLSLQNKTGIPWYFIGMLHLRESDCNFHTHLHNGDSLNARTHNVPAGRPLKGKPPFDFEYSAIDALQFEGFTKITDWSIERIAFCAEQYNGWGYRMRDVPSAYLWAGSNQYNKGKFIRDGVLDRNVRDTQLGTMCILKYLLAHYATGPEKVVTTEPVREETIEEYETPAKAVIPRPTTVEMNQVSRKHWWSDLWQWTGLAGVLGAGTYKSGEMSGIEALKPIIFSIKEVFEAIGAFGVISILAAVAAYFAYQKKLMKDDIQEGRFSPSGGDPTKLETTSDPMIAKEE